MFCGEGFEEFDSYHDRVRVASLPTQKPMAKGDWIGLRLDFEKMTCEGLHNGRGIGTLFEDVPSEVLVAMSKGSRPHKGELRFREGVRR